MNSEDSRLGPESAAIGVGDLALVLVFIVGHLGGYSKGSGLVAGKGGLLKAGSFGGFIVPLVGQALATGGNRELGLFARRYGLIVRLVADHNGGNSRFHRQGGGLRPHIFAGSIGHLALILVAVMGQFGGHRQGVGLGAAEGGLFEGISKYYSELSYNVKMSGFCVKDDFVRVGTVEEQLKDNLIDAESIIEKIKNEIR